MNYDVVQTHGRAGDPDDLRLFNRRVPMRTPRLASDLDEAHGRAIARAGSGRHVDAATGSDQPRS